MLGFDTPSKRIAEQEEKKQQQTSKGIGIGASAEALVKAEAIKRTEALGQLIISDSYNSYSPEQKIHILQEFAFLSKVTSCLWFLKTSLLDKYDRKTNALNWEEKEKWPH